MIGIYQFKNIINNKIYIGQSKNIECRYQRHLYDAKKFNLSEQSIRDIANNKSYSYLRQFYNNHM